MRRVLRFRPEYFDLILKGLKTSTIRLPNGGEYAETLVLTDGTRKVEAKLIKTEKLKLAEAAEKYKSEGFSSPQDFLRHVRQIYPAITLDDEVTMIHFMLKTNP